MAQSAQAGNSEISENHNALRSALCAMRIQSPIVKPSTFNLLYVNPQSLSATVPARALRGRRVVRLRRTQARQAGAIPARHRPPRTQADSGEAGRPNPKSKDARPLQKITKVFL